MRRMGRRLADKAERPSPIVWPTVVVTLLFEVPLRQATAEGTLDLDATHGGLKRRGSRCP